MTQSSSHGGFRLNAGRKKNNIPTKTIRIPVILEESVKQLAANFNEKLKSSKGADVFWMGALDIDMLSQVSLPLYSSHVQAGIPSPADDHIEDMVDLGKHLVKHKQSTFLLKATGESMTGAGIFPGDMLVVDRAIIPTSGHIIIAALDGEFTVKRLSQMRDKVVLCAENPAYQDIEITENMAFSIWGVVTNCIHSLL
ncbi:S24/S26 family peptidase [Candidatus Bealeia paramacronuclearis]|uniref:S24/S26 family peptidase n=1 Tax=Candidatus Bealeia paramacronuclearis TaxID=1921001 RepID=A0ABZ2C571_9PROT|nr:S24/S26 family peptidase [Candidatus Bealeia paramacronuclearis]